MKRQPIAVTPLPPLVVPVDGIAPDGQVLLLRKDRSIAYQPVKRFVWQKGSSKRFDAIAQLIQLAGGKEIDYSLVKAAIRLLVEPIWTTNVADAVSKRLYGRPGPWVLELLPAVFNREIQSARVVMWWPEGAPRPIVALYCPDPTVATLISLLRGHEVIACRRPGCGKFFRPERSNQRYHSDNCAARDRMARFRKRQEQRRKKGKANAKN